MTLSYLDASACVKLVRTEPETSALRRFLADAGIVSCSLLLTEVPRAIRRAANHDPMLPVESLLALAAEVLETFALVPLDDELLVAAGALSEPVLRTLDAIHVAAAASLGSAIDAFVSYDERQAAVARLAGLRTYAPGV